MFQASKIGGAGALVEKFDGLRLKNNFML